MGYPLTTELYGDHLIGMECNPDEEEDDAENR